MSIMDLSKPARAIGKLGNGILLTIQPIADGIEILSTSSNNWVRDHALNVQAKAIRQDAVREEEHIELLNQARANARERTLRTNDRVREVAMLEGVDQHKQRVHEAKLQQIANVPDSVILELATKRNLTNADILRTLNVGNFVAEEQDDSATTFKVEPEASRFS